LSLVVPVFNEEDMIELFLSKCDPILDDLLASFPSHYDCEYVFVDDGSSDRTVERLLACREQNARIKVLSLSRNFGKDVALAAGLEHASGAGVIPIDVDLQDPPELIPQLVSKWLEGYEVVYAVRSDRTSDSWFKRNSAGAFYRIHNALSDFSIPSHAGDYRLLDRVVVESLRKFPERARFMKGLYAWVGYRQACVPYRREERAAGESKWKYWRLWNFALDGITGATTVPLRIWTYIGAAIAILTFLYAAYLFVKTMTYGIDVPGYASLMIVVLFLGGINLLCLGVIGEYLGRTYLEAKSRPLYFVREAVGFADWQEGQTGAWQTIGRNSDGTSLPDAEVSVTLNKRHVG
jgi:glycosyltransferase involved in cell wall biosynthesis